MAAIELKCILEWIITVIPVFIPLSIDGKQVMVCGYL